MQITIVLYHLLRKRSFDYINGIIKILNLLLSSDKKYEKKFALKMCHRWSGLKHILSDFDKNWEEYLQYIMMIPSFGALMFSKRFQKILFGKNPKYQAQPINSLFMSNDYKISSIYID